MSRKQERDRQLHPIPTYGRIEAGPSLFRTNKNTGFQIVFENKFILSVQFGPMHYCANRKDLSFDDMGQAIKGEIPDQESEDAEIAIIDSTGTFVPLAYNSVQSNVLPKTVVLVAHELLMPVPDFDRIRDILVNGMNR